MPAVRIGAALVVSAALLAGCGGRWWPWGEGAGGEVTRSYPGARVYACDGGKRLLVRYGPENRYAMIIFPEREFRLDAEASAGGKYTNGRTVLSSRGDEATLQEAGTVIFANCKIEAAG
ncbi:MAG: MliC family protein [Betaproteobacteria bacterium]|nr:MliC family protein [Betaproteobacteria bacterium]